MLSRSSNLFIQIVVQNVPGRKVNIWEVIVSVFLRKKRSVYVHVSYSERFPRESYVTVEYRLYSTDEQHAMSSHELRSGLMLMVKFSKILYYTR
jgi:hypothetical protein